MRRLALSPRGRRRSPLGRDFWLYFSGQAVSQFGSSFTAFALPLLVYKLTGSATSLAITTAATFVPYLLFGLVLGAVSDRVDRRLMMLRTDLARAAVIAALPLLALAGLLSVWEIYLVTFVQSTLTILFNCGEFAAIPALVGEGELVAANARIMATNNIGPILGPSIAGALVVLVPVSQLLFVDAASFVVSAGCLAAICRSFNPGPVGERSGSPLAGLMRDVREGLVYVWGHRLLRSISLMMALINFVYATATSQLVLFAKRTLHASNAEIGFSLPVVPPASSPSAWRLARCGGGSRSPSQLSGPSSCRDSPSRRWPSCTPIWLRSPSGGPPRVSASCSTSTPALCARRSCRPSCSAEW